MSNKTNQNNHRRALAIVNDFNAAQKRHCPEGWKRYRVGGLALYAPATCRAWWSMLGDLGIVALAILAVWAALAAGATR